jgi:serine/threonine protein kinase
MLVNGQNIHVDFTVTMNLFWQGTLTDGRVIAVKQFSKSSLHGKRQFVAEVATISAVQHRNLVKLHGCCIDSNTYLLVYEYLENGSLDRALFGENTCAFIFLFFLAKRNYLHFVPNKY